MTAAVRFYGLASLRTLKVVEFYRCREEAEQALLDVIRDEPELEAEVAVVVVDLGGAAVEWAQVPVRRQL